MYRKDLMEWLRERPWTLSALARELEVPRRDLEDDVAHLLKSLKHGSDRAVITPASCRKCGFTFAGDRLRRPSKCPSCRSTWVSEPTVFLEAR